jgi:hypothetical protein
MTFIEAEHPRAAAGRFVDKDQSAPDVRLAAPERLTVTWRHPTTQLTSAIGTLSFTGSLYRFGYLPAARDVVDFRPLLGFPNLDHRYESAYLFPIFQQRSMDPRRRDFDDFIASIGLSGTPSRWDQIAASGGQREGDTLGLVPA